MEIHEAKRGVLKIANALMVLGNKQNNGKKGRGDLNLRAISIGHAEKAEVRKIRSHEYMPPQLAALWITEMYKCDYLKPLQRRVELRSRSK